MFCHFPYLFLFTRLVWVKRSCVLLPTHRFLATFYYFTIFFKFLYTQFGEYIEVSSYEECFKSKLYALALLVYHKNLYTCQLFISRVLFVLF